MVILWCQEEGSTRNLLHVVLLILFLDLGPDYKIIHCMGVHWYVQLWWMDMLFHTSNNLEVKKCKCSSIYHGIVPTINRNDWDSKMPTPNFSDTAYCRVLFSWLQNWLWAVTHCHSLPGGTMTQDPQPTARPQNYPNSNFEVWDLINAYHFYVTVSVRNLL